MTSLDRLTLEELEVRQQQLAEAGSALGAEGVALPEAAAREYQRIREEIERRRSAAPGKGLTRRS